MIKFKGKVAVTGRVKVISFVGWQYQGIIWDDNESAWTEIL